MGNNALKMTKVWKYDDYSTTSSDSTKEKSILIETKGKEKPLSGSTHGESTGTTLASTYYHYILSVPKQTKILGITCLKYITVLTMIPNVHQTAN